MRVVLLAGGTGAAKLALGLQDRLQPGELTVIANTGDDLERWGLQVSPDLDSVLYRLAGIFNERAGWGIADETFAALGMMGRLGEETWFALGDRDLAVHVLRTHLLRGGMRASEVALELGRRLGIPSCVLPMSDDPLRTYFDTDSGRLTFQEYFVREGTRPKLQGIEFRGLEAARPAPESLAAIRASDLVVIGPSNPLISIGPIVSLLGDDIRPEAAVVVSPLVGGRSLKGPTVEMMAAMGREPTAVGVAEFYRGRARTFLLDEVDAAFESKVVGLGYRVVMADTVMADRAAAGRLADAVLASGMVSA